VGFVVRNIGGGARLDDGIGCGGAGPRGKGSIDVPTGALPFQRSLYQAGQPLDFLHVDLMGPLPYTAREWFSVRYGRFGRSFMHECCHNVEEQVRGIQGPHYTYSTMGVRFG
jgi:hypothetical protein